MSSATLIALGIGFTLTAYAIFAGADFGAGILDLTCGASPQPRGALARAIGPLWEANHVWLIFTITLLFSTFPTGFAALGTVLLAPFTLALMAIVVRGVAFSLRASVAPPAKIETLLGGAFGAASVIAPILLGASAGALAQVSSSSVTSATPRRSRGQASSPVWSDSWRSPCAPTSRPALSSTGSNKPDSQDSPSTSAGGASARDRR